MLTSTSVDWLRWTCPPGGHPTEAVNPNLPCFDRAHADIKPLPPYKRAIRLLCARIDWHDLRPELKTMVTMTGDDLRAAEQMGTGARTLALTCKRALGTPTRLDLALDVFDGGVAAGDVWQWREDGEIRTAARSARLVRGRDGAAATGDTVYIGSRTSTKMLRIYDKAAEQGLTGVDWLRIEVELKGEQARRALDMLTRHTVSETTMAYVTSCMVIHNNEWWKNVIGSHPVAAPRVPRPETDGDTWLYEVVLPLIERKLRTDDGDGTLRAAIEEMLSRTGGA